jgi:segregation and condensation protein B
MAEEFNPNPAERDEPKAVDPDDQWSMDDFVDGMSGIADGYDLEDLSRAYAQLLAEQARISESLDSDGPQFDAADHDAPAVANSGPEFPRAPRGGIQSRQAAEQTEVALAETSAAEQETLSAAKIGGTPFFDLRRFSSQNTEPEAEDRVAITPQRIVESILFVGTPDNAPISGRTLASLMRGVSPDEIEKYVAELNASYRTDGSAYCIVQELMGYRLELAASHATVRNQFYGQIREVKLSQPVIDVLAIVAYHQPVPKAVVEKLIGSPCAGALNQLLRRRLVSLSKEAGLGAVYRTTERFLELFDLDSLDDLPQSESVDNDEETLRN